MKLSTQFAIVTSVFITLMFIGVALFQVSTLSKHFEQQQYNWSKTLTVSVAETLASDIINGKSVAVHEVLEHIVASNSEIEYAYVSDFDHRIFSHTFNAGFPVKLVRKHKETELQNTDEKHGEEHDLHHFKLDGVKIIDVAFPVIKGMTSHLHLGINQAQHKALLNEIFTELIILFVLATVCGVFFSVALARYLVRPLGELAMQLKAFGDGEEVKLKSAFNASHEIKALESSFKTMIHVRKSAEKELVKYRDHLEELVEEKTIDLLSARDLAEKASLAKSEFLSRMSHELRTPMNAILGFGQMLELDAGGFSDTQKSSVKEILDAGQHLLNLINEVLDLAHIESGHIDLSLRTVMLGEIIVDSLNLIRPLANERDIEVSLLDDGIDITLEQLLQKNYAVISDVTRLRQVFINLLSNAIKYNNKNGKVTISCSITSNNKIRVSISDTGKGVSVEKQGYLFKAFNRLGAEETEIDGTGIGLVITKNIVELMGGNIGVESELNKGSTFWFELPRSESTPKNISVPKQDKAIDPLHGQVTDNKSILYIEDNLANLRLVSHLLGHLENLDMLEAYEPLKGLRLAEEYNPDLILLDINLPNIDGYEVLSRLRKSKVTRNTPVIAISANAMEKDIERGIEAGFDGYITKPIDVKALLEMVKRELSLE